MKTLALSAALALSLAAGAASAATVTFGPMPADVDPNPSAATFVGDYSENVTGSVANVRRSPFEDTAGAGTEPYSSITGSATFQWATLRNALSFVWGSPDAYNQVDFYLAGAKVDSYPGFGSGVNIAESLVTFTEIGTAGLFDAVTFTSGSPAFEFAGLDAPAAVPLPAGGLLLLTALGAAGLARRRAA